MRPVGIEETIHRALAKLAMRVAGDQAKTSCGNLQLCAGLESGIEGEIHNVGHRILERVRERREETEEEAATEAEKKEGGGGIAACLNYLTIETGKTEKEAEDGLEEALGMDTQEDVGSKGEEGGGGTQQALEALEFLTQEAEPSGTTLVDACNGFNELIRLVMLWTV